jgi:purine-binding chemotaxis protein CheW
MTPRDPREILEERARTLAKPLASVAAFTGSEMLSFTVGRERFAIDSRFVFAVFRLSDLVPVPGARPPVVGLTRWRGDVLTLLDIRRVVGGAAGALDDLGRVIVVGETSAELGILADTIDDIRGIDLSALHPVPAERRLDGESVLLGVSADAVHVLNTIALLARQADSQGSSSSAPSPSSASLS